MRGGIYGIRTFDDSRGAEKRATREDSSSRCLVSLPGQPGIYVLRGHGLQPKRYRLVFTYLPEVKQGYGCFYPRIEV